MFDIQPRLVRNHYMNKFIFRSLANGADYELEYIVKFLQDKILKKSWKATGKDKLFQSTYMDSDLPNYSKLDDYIILSSIAFVKSDWNEIQYFQNFKAQRKRRLIFSIINVWHIVCEFNEYHFSNNMFFKLTKVTDCYEQFLHYDEIIFE